MTTTFDPSQSPSNQINILDNAGFEIWQRGNTFNSVASGVYTADRWSTDVGGGNVLNITKETTNIDSGLASLSFNVSSAPSTVTSLDVAQTIENGIALYVGKVLTFSVRVKSNAAVQIGLKDGQTGAPSITLATHPGDNQWHTLTATRTIQDGAAHSVALFLGFMASFGGSAPVVSQTYFDSATLVVGTNPAPFVPLHLAIDLARCQRYYEITGTTYGTTCRALGINNGSQYQLSNYVQFKATKRIIPTMTITGNIVWEQGSTTNVIASYGFAAGNADESGFEFEAGKSAGGNFPSLLQGKWTASADL